VYKRQSISPPNRAAPPSLYSATLFIFAPPFAQLTSSVSRQCNPVNPPPIVGQKKRGRKFFAFLFPPGGLTFPPQCGMIVLCVIRKHPGPVTFTSLMLLRSGCSPVGHDEELGGPGVRKRLCKIPCGNERSMSTGYPGSPPNLNK